tara:strand:+ start:91 stop:726 length:636 start_codon:yes stop_codon:yes gene_type:complete
MVTKQRGEYLVRLKSEQATRERESSSWPTPQAGEEKATNPWGKQNQRMLSHVAILEDSPPDLESSNLTGKNPERWPTPNTMDVLPPRPTEKLAEENRKRGGRKNRQALSNLREAVQSPKYQNWPTPTATQAEKPQGPNSKQKGLESQAKWATPEAQNQTGYQTKNGKLNPNWVEQLMGLDVGRTQLPTEWTGCDSSETALSRQQQQKRGQS